MSPFKEYPTEVKFENLKDAVDTVLERNVGVLKRNYAEDDQSTEQIVVYRTGHDGYEHPSSPVVLIGYDFSPDEPNDISSQDLSNKNAAYSNDYMKRGHTIQTPAQGIIDAVDLELKRKTPSVGDDSIST